jgi:hypothetical protein
MKSLGIFHWNKNNKSGLEASIASFRKYHPNIPYFLSADGGSQDQYDICQKYNVIYLQNQSSLGYPSQHWGYNKHQIYEFMKRIMMAAIAMDTTHFMFSEDDVICLNEIQFDENWEIASYDTRYIDGVLAPNGHNEFSYINEEIQNEIEKISGVRPNHPYYGAGAGTIFKTSTYIENFYKYMDFLNNNFDRFHPNQHQFGWNDYFLQMLYFVAGKQYSINPRLYNIHPENPSINLDEIKVNYDIAHNYKNFYEGRNIKKMETNKVEDLQTAWTDHKKFAIWLVENINPKVTVDLGVDYGYSLYCLATPRIGKVYGIDLFDVAAGYSSGSDTYDVVMEFKEKHQFDNVEVIKGDFCEIAKVWKEPIQILHIDGDHSYECVKRDWDTWSPFVENGGVIIMHDLFSYRDTVGKFYNEIELPKAYFSESCGLGVVCQDATILEKILDNFPNCKSGNI